VNPKRTTTIPRENRAKPQLTLRLSLGEPNIIEQKAYGEELSIIGPRNDPSYDWPTSLVGHVSRKSRQLMPSDDHPMIWNATPHTIAKIEMLSAYLTAWFQILGRTMRGKDLIYIDGFAGPGEYINHPDGSPIAAIKAAMTARSNSHASWQANSIHCAFIEVDPDRYSNLLNRIEPYDNRLGLHLHSVRGTFVNGLPRLQAQLPSLSSGNPCFVFIDPFGATGVPFSVVAAILSNPTSEVLINLDADGIARVMRASTNAANATTMDSIFGDASWRSIHDRHLRFQGESRAVLDLYRSKLRALPDVDYTFPFEMRSQSGTLNYFLVFASQHHRGLEKMKEAMRQIDNSGAYCFSDAHSEESRLFHFDNPEDYARQIFDTFQGQTVPYAAVRDYVLNETPLISPKKILKQLEDERQLHVVGAGAGRRRGTFADDHIASISIIFHPEWTVRPSENEEAPQMQSLFEGLL